MREHNMYRKNIFHNQTLTYKICFFYLIYLFCLFFTLAPKVIFYGLVDLGHIEKISGATPGSVLRDHFLTVLRAMFRFGESNWG